MSVIVFSGDLMTQSKLGGACQQLGVACQFALSTAKLMDLVAETADAVVLVDLNSVRGEIADLVTQLKQSASPPSKIIAFGPHVNDAGLAAATSAGCDRVLTRGQLLTQPAAAIQQLVG